MNKKILSFALVCTLVISILVPVNTIKAEGASKDFDTSRYGDVIDVGAKIRKLANDEEYNAKLDKKLKEMGSNIKLNQVEGTSEENGNDNFTVDGGTKVFVALDDINGYYLKDFTLRSIGENVEVWVAEDLAFYDNDGNLVEGQPAHVINQEQVDKIKDVFDDTIYIKDTEFFGTPDSHTGKDATLPEMIGLPQDYYKPKDGEERIMIMVDNVRDDQYYDSSYPFFIAGFFSPTLERYTDRNIITLDSKDWETRLESTFLGTTAHEFQHLIHSDNDSLEETWINEGMSDFAEYLCFGEHPWGHVNFFLDHPENSLVEWDEHEDAETGPETLADYGQAYLLQLYLNDHYGKEFVKALAQDKSHGIESVNKILEEFNAEIDFNELFKRFTLAVAMDSPEPEDGVYNFESIDLKINFESALEYDKDGVPAWGGDYKVIEKANKIQNIIFDGISFLPTPWNIVDDPLASDNKVLWGNTGNEVNNNLILKADLTKVDSATLKFDNYIDIEEQWDFGVVQVSTDKGKTWSSLKNENTRDDVVDEGYPAIKDSMPGFTGHYDNWVKEEFDLTPYVGEEILINFRYMTDWGTVESGWYIDNIEISEIGYSNDGSSLEEFMSIDEIKGVYVEYAVSFINEKSKGKGNNKQHYRVLNIDPFNVKESDAIQLKEFFSGGNNYMVVWYAAPSGTKGTVDYTYEIISKKNYNKKKKK